MNGLLSLLWRHLWDTQEPRLEAGQVFGGFFLFVFGVHFHWSEMAFLHKSLAVLGVIFISPVLVPALFLARLFYDFLHSDLPPGIDQPLKLLFYHSLLMTTMVLVSSISYNGAFPFCFGRMAGRQWLKEKKKRGSSNSPPWSLEAPLCKPKNVKLIHKAGLILKAYLIFFLEHYQTAASLHLENSFTWILIIIHLFMYGVPAELDVYIIYIYI